MGVPAASNATLTGPTKGAVNEPSRDFSVILDGSYTGTITPAAASGTFTPASLVYASLVVERRSFTFTPSAPGAVSISISASPALTLHGSPIAFTASATTRRRKGLRWFPGLANRRPSA
jgi:hypothetical protein